MRTEKNFYYSLNQILFKYLKGKGLGKYKVFDHLYKTFTKNIKKKFVIINKTSMFLDEKDILGLSINKVHEPFETKLVKTMLKKGDTVLDAGANIGYYTLIFADLVGPKGRVYAFEPDPENFAILKKNIAINNYKNVELINAAVADKTGAINFFHDSRSTAAHRVFKEDKNEKAIRVKVVTLDNYFSRKSLKIDLIKFDIQGAEVNAINGMKKLIKKNKNIKIISEFWPYGINKTGHKASEFTSFFVKQGFEMFELYEKDETLIKTNSRDLLQKYTIKSQNHADLLMIRDK